MGDGRPSKLSVMTSLRLQGLLFARPRPRFSTPSLCYCDPARIEARGAPWAGEAGSLLES
jgi:hypothetical protein